MKTFFPELLDCPRLAKMKEADDLFVKQISEGVPEQQVIEDWKLSNRKIYDEIMKEEPMSPKSMVLSCAAVCFILLTVSCIYYVWANFL